MNFKKKSEIRIKGLPIGIDLHDEDQATEISDKALKQGLLMNTDGSSLLFLSNFLIKEKTTQKGIRLLKNCI